MRRPNIRKSLHTDTPERGTPRTHTNDLRSLAHENIRVNIRESIECEINPKAIQMGCESANTSAAPNCPVTDNKPRM
jgi:hypothetical protein